VGLFSPGPRSVAMGRMSQIATPLATTVLALLAIVATSASSVSSTPRPTHEEWKEAKANETAAAADTAVAESKRVGVDKVVLLLTSLRDKVLAQGGDEARTYDRFACFCKDTTSEKSGAIAKGEDEKATLGTDIGLLEETRGQLDTTISGLETDIGTIKDEVNASMTTHREATRVYELDEADLSGAVIAIRNALAALKASKGGLTLVQLQAIAKNVRSAVLMADALDIGSASTHPSTALLLQEAPDVPMEDYKFQSDGVIATLEELLTDFRGRKASLDNAEVTRVAAHDQQMQLQEDRMKAKNVELDTARKQKADAQEQIGMKSQQLTTVAATLLDDRKYMGELSSMCAGKAKTWDQRLKTRTDEISALTAAIGLLESAVRGNTTSSTLRLVQKGTALRHAEAVARNPRAMEAVEADAETADDAASAASAATHGGGGPISEPPPLAFLQRRLHHEEPTHSHQPLQIAPRLSALARHSNTVAVQAVSAGASPDAEAAKASATEGRRSVAALLRSRGSELNSTLLTALAGRINAEPGDTFADPFAKVKQLIQELLERLQQQEAMEATQKGWCDTSVRSAEQRRDHAAEAVKELNGKIAELEATRDRLAEDLQALDNGIGKLQNESSAATSVRTEESAENARTVEEAKQGLSAVQQATKILGEFYASAGEAEVETGANKTAVDDAPDTAFDFGEAYQGSLGAWSGIYGMLEVINGDFTRTVRETEKAEARAQQDHDAFLAATGESIAAKERARTEKRGQQDTIMGELSSASGDLTTKLNLLKGAIKERIELIPPCDQPSMSFADRVARREDEIAALRRGLCILSNYELHSFGSTDHC